MGRIATQVREIIREHAGETDVGLPADEVDILVVFGFDSIDLAEISLLLEEEFDIDLGDVFAEWRTAGDVVRSVEAMLAPAVASSAPPARVLP